MQIQLADSFPVTLPESNSASLGSGYQSAPECRTMTSTNARTVRVALALHNTATVPSRAYGVWAALRAARRVPLRRTSAAGVSRPARLSLHRMYHIKVPHQRLILKLKSHGIGISIIHWIEQWLTDRRQRVVVDGEVSNWKPVLSGVPQGSVLGPILFLIYINDLEEGVTSKILKFADDTKLFRKIKGNGDKQQLQDDIDKLIKWSEKWQMLFNFQKCKCLHAGHGNTGVNYEMGGTIICKTVKEKDLGVTMNANMKVSEQCRIAASKGNQILGMIRRNITYKEKGLIVPLYKAIVRPHLEYCIQAWRPYLRKDIDMLEKVQRRTTKFITGLRDLSYDDRLKECGLTTLETRRLRGDQIEVFKILNGHENIDPNIFFSKLRQVK